MKPRRARYIHGLWEEPFRIFFPTGIFLGMAGVSLWPAYYAGWVATYPATAHARLMVEGFMASFIIGFLGTAGPRITSTMPFSRGEVGTLLTLDILAAGLHFGESHRAGDVIFIVCLAIFVFAIARRFVNRSDSPPPNFALVALGLLNGLTGAILVGLFENQLYSKSYLLGALFLEQGFVLLPILGIAPFLLPRLFNISLPDMPESRALPAGWKSRALFAATTGLIVDLTFVLESLRLTLFAPWLRFTAILIYLAATMPSGARSFLADSLRIGISTIVVGIGCEALWPLYRVGALHIVFISGFSFVAMTVGIRVVFGHSGNAHLFRKRLPFFIVAASLIFLAALSRYVADIAPRARTIHLLAAAICWLLAALIWSIKVLPKVLIAEPE
jgi:uncharacterized protein involved in response to NO